MREKSRFRARGCKVFPFFTRHFARSWNRFMRELERKELAQLLRKLFFAPPASLVNSIVYFNSAPINDNYSGTANSFCCLTPLSTGTSNIVSDPMLIDFAAGNFRLQTNSPCINAGSGFPQPGEKDLDGRPRFGNRIDIGAYEFQGAGIGEFSHWLASYGLPTNGSADTADVDSDGHNNWQEWIAGTDPTNSLSILRMLKPTFAPTGLRLSWQSISGKFYLLKKASNLVDVPVFSIVASNIVGQADTTFFVDSSATNSATCFYRVQVQ